MTLPDGLRDLLLAMAALSVLSLVAAAVLLAFLWRRLRRINVKPGSGFWDTLRQVPLALPVVLDLLDLALDIFSAPLIWILLDRLRLRQLRDVASVEAIIPFTGPIPLLTISWFLARLGVGGSARPPDGAGELLEGEQVAPGKWRPRA